MKIKLLQVVADTTVLTKSIFVNSFLHSFWFWIAIVELLVITILIVKIKSSTANLAFGNLSKQKVKQAIKQDIDMNNVMNSINKSGELYKELSRVCHPDLFLDIEMKKLADRLFQDISSNKRNYEKLILLKERASNELKIHFLK